jgi:uncharacterized protein (DUF362 family)
LNFYFVLPILKNNPVSKYMKRKDFLHKSLLLGASFSFLPATAELKYLLQADHATSRVVQITNHSIRKSNSLDSDQIEKMLDEGISHLYRSDNPQKIWENLFSIKDTIGIKVNCLSGERASSHKVLIEAIIERLRKAGISAGNIVIWDRLNEDLESGGYRLNLKNRNRVLCFGNDAIGYDNNLFINNSVGSLITRTLTQLCTATINVPVLKDHGIVGITLSMKNFFGAIHNPNKYHDNIGNPYVADLYEMDIIRRKTRLTICDAIDAQYEGGPPFKPQWTWPLNSLLFTVDGVALDRVGWEIIESKRKEMGYPTLKDIGRKPEYILTAGKKNLGQSDLQKIDWQKIGAS